MSEILLDQVQDMSKKALEELDIYTKELKLAGYRVITNVPDRHHERFLTVSLRDPFVSIGVAKSGSYMIWGYTFKKPISDWDEAVEFLEKKVSEL